MFVIDLPKAEVINHPGDLQRRLEGVEKVAIDTETDGVSVRQKYTPLLDRIVCWSVATSNFRLFLPVELVFDCDFLFANPKISKIFHNAKYDLHCFENLGIRIEGDIYDTMVMAWLLDTENKDHSLKGLSKKYLSISKNKSFDQLFSKSLFLVDDFELSVEYATFDAYVTYLLFEELEKELRKVPWRKGKNMFDYYQEVEQKFLRCLYRMERRGITIDLEKLEQIRRQVEEIVAEKIRTVVDLAGKPINLDSPQQVSEFVYSKFPIVERTGKTGLPSTSTRVLKKLASYQGYQEYIEPILQYRAYNKLLNSFIDPILEKVRLFDGERLYSTFDIVGTETGRIASSKPNVMNIPKKQDKVGIRSVFMASKGYKLIVCDYSQAEIRVMAHLCGDRNMIEACKTGDFYTSTAKRIFGIRKLTEAQRAVVKSLVLGLHYGSSPETIANQLAEIGYSYTTKEIKSFLDKYFSLYPHFSYYYNNVHYLVQDGPVPAMRTLLGRYRHLHNLTNNFNQGRREALNSGPQAGVADLLRGAMIFAENNPRLKELGCRMLLQVHDELVFEAPVEVVDECAIIIERILKDPLEGFGIKLEVPLEVEISITERWGRNEM